MKINIYYGGRGMIEDPTLVVINKMQEVLEELHVKVERFNLYELKNTIPTLPQTLKDADGVIFASTVEWHGIGGFMYQFLDACWLYGDKEKISQLYMCPVVMSTTYGEREGKLQLATAWEVLGGLPCSGICGYIADTIGFEMNEAYLKLIEKKAENLYRTINQKTPSLPASNQAVKQMVYSTKNIDLTPQETEQLSQYITDDSYVQRQKEDIQELTSLFRDMMENSSEKEEEDDYIQDFKSHFTAQSGFSGSYRIIIEEMKKPLIIKVYSSMAECYYGSVEENVDVEMQMQKAVMDEIVSGRMTFQRAFMGGDMKMKGDFRILRSLDQIFNFIE